jgi:hypothetical protein
LPPISLIKPQPVSLNAQPATTALPFASTATANP